MIKLIASDVDGTLIGSGENELSEDISRKLRTLISYDCKLAIASGRTYHSLSTLFRQYGSDIYYICCDGALCVHGDRTLYDRPISAESIRKAILTAKSNGLRLLLSSRDHGYAFSFGNEDFIKMLTDENTDDIVRAVSQADVKAPIYKIAFYGKAPNFATIPSELRRSYRGNGWCEFVYRYANKGTALSALQNSLYIYHTETAAIGDGENDLEMLKNAKYPFALTEELAKNSGILQASSAENALNEILKMKLRSEK